MSKVMTSTFAGLSTLAIWTVHFEPDSEILLYISNLIQSFQLDFYLSNLSDWFQLHFFLPNLSHYFKPLFSTKASVLFPTKASVSNF